jgi:AcrR family transcriptional regulator
MVNSMRGDSSEAGRNEDKGCRDLASLGDNVLGAAAELFLRNGFDVTSMDAIAERARVSKRTLYSRHRDKAALFRAVMDGLLGQLLAPMETFRFDREAPLDTVLISLARRLVRAAAQPRIVAAHRLMTFEAQRRPDLGRWLASARQYAVILRIAGVLEAYRAELRVADLTMAAEQFACLTVDNCLRSASLGASMTMRESDQRIRSAVDLFLAGARRADVTDAGMRRTVSQS